MDEAVALVVAAPVLALALWAVAFIGGYSNGEARAVVAAELAAQAAARASGPEAADAAERVALGATLSTCARTSTTFHQAQEDRAAAVTVVCEVSGPLPGNTVCVTGYAQARPAVSTHVHAACPSP